jgi:hypothetical protein
MGVLVVNEDIPGSIFEGFSKSSVGPQVSEEW